MSRTTTGANILEIENKLRKMSYDFADCMDYLQYDDLVQLFTPDALLGRILEVHRGREEILAGVQKKALTSSRHPAYFNELPLHRDRPPDGARRGLQRVALWRRDRRPLARRPWFAAEYAYICARQPGFSWNALGTAT